MAELLITVSQLKCACVDREWRRRWLRGEDPPTMQFGEAGAMPVQGRLFHQLAEEFTEWLEGSPEVAVGLADANSLWAQLYDGFAKPHLDELIAAGRLPSAHHLSQALRAFCDRLVTLRSRATHFATWADIYLTREYRMDRVPFALGDSTLLISGRPDAVRLHPGGVEVVDYKLSRGGNLKHDLVQLAIYARLLRMVKPGLVFNGVLEFYEPGLHAIEVSFAELEALFDEIVQPVLREFVGTNSAESSPPPPDPAAASKSHARGTATANSIESILLDPTAAAIEICFAHFKLPVRILGHEDAPQLTRYRVQPASGVKVVSLANRSEDLQVALRLAQAPLIQAGPGYLTIDVPKPMAGIVHWRDAMARMKPDAGPVAFPIGVGIDNSLLVADLAEPNTCHALVAGAAGSGKSEFLKSMIATLIARHGPKTLCLTLIDPKLVTFGGLKNAPHLMSPVITDLGAAIACLERVVEDMEARYEQLAAGGFENLAQRGASETMPFRVIVCDEFGDLALREKREKEHFENIVARIAQKGRAAGIHLVLATQRPDRKIVTGLIKSNLPLKVCMRVTTAVNSGIVIDQPGAENLLGRGDLLCDRGHGIERAQSPFISQEELRALVDGCRG
jgi:DNA segregation ATPase FtsK/SpoIIIE, S-DNA-T family